MAVLRHLNVHNSSLPPRVNSKNSMNLQPTWQGYVADWDDVQKIVHACSDEVAVLSPVPRRLDELEREEVVRHGTVFVFEESRAGMMRWTDHLKCGQSRMSGPFLTYTERLAPPGQLPLTRASVCLTKKVMVDGKPAVEKWHLVAYYNRDYRNLRRVSDDPTLNSIRVDAGLYQTNSSRNRSGTGLFSSSSSTSSSATYAPSSTQRSATPPPMLGRQTTTSLFGASRPSPIQLQQQQPQYSTNQTPSRPPIFPRSGLPSSSSRPQSMYAPGPTLPPLQNRSQPQPQQSRPAFGGMRASTPPPQSSRSGGLFGSNRSSTPPPQQQSSRSGGLFGSNRSSTPPPQQQQSSRSGIFGGLRSSTPPPQQRAASPTPRGSMLPTPRTSTEYSYEYQEEDVQMVGAIAGSGSRHRSGSLGGWGAPSINRPQSAMERPRLPSLTSLNRPSFNRFAESRSKTDAEMLDALTRGKR